MIYSFESACDLLHELTKYPCVLSDNSELVLGQWLDLVHHTPIGMSKTKVTGQRIPHMPYGLKEIKECMIDTLDFDRYVKKMTITRWTKDTAKDVRYPTRYTLKYCDMFSYEELMQFGRGCGIIDPSIIMMGIGMDYSKNTYKPDIKVDIGSQSALQESDVNVKTYIERLVRNRFCVEYDHAVPEFGIGKKGFHLSIQKIKFDENHHVKDVGPIELIGSYDTERWGNISLTKWKFNNESIFPMDEFVWTNQLVPICVQYSNDDTLGMFINIIHEDVSEAK